MKIPKIVLVRGPNKKNNEHIKKTLDQLKIPHTDVPHNLPAVPPSLLVLMADGIPYRGLEEAIGFAKELTG